MGNRISAIDSPTPKEETFLQGKEMGMPDHRAAAFAGYSNPTAEAKRLRTKPHIAMRLADIEQQHQREMDISRHDVQRLVLEATEMARIQADPMAMLRAAQELNKMCGFYAAEVKEIRLSDDQTKRKKQMELASDEELLRLSGLEGGFDVALEGEFEVVPNSHQDE